MEVVLFTQGSAQALARGSHNWQVQLEPNTQGLTLLGMASCSTPSLHCSYPWPGWHTCMSVAPPSIPLSLRGPRAQEGPVSDHQVVEMRKGMGCSTGRKMTTGICGDP